MTFLHEEMGLATTRGDARTARGFALELLGVLARKRPPSDRKVIQARLALGAIETQLGDFAAADATFAACRVHLGDSADELRVNLALNEAALRWHQGHKAQAAAGFKEALAVQRKLCGDENNLVANLLINLGVVSRHMGERDEARRCYEEALAMLRKLHGDDHTMVAITRTNLGRVLEDVGQLAAAIEMHRAALATHRKLGGEQSQDYLTCLHNLAGALLMHGAVAEARERFTDLVRRRREVLGDQHIDVADSLVGLARATAKSDPAAAEPSYRQAHAIYAAAVGAADVRTLDAELGLLEVLIARGGDAMAQAEQLGVALYARATAALPATAPIPTAVARALAQLYSGTDRASQAEAWQQRAR
jgi:tetratricopeptide (TPR) repeat protein